ncbi:MAG: ABC transporter permease [Polyangiaceae bacterium]|nr:ABC transporter permease [Polyangiaceae bacterium]
MVGSLWLSLPRVLDRIEGSGFVPLVAARHVRAGKSGFLTIISFLSIAGVGVSAFALCAVVSIMGGFGADLKRKILGNNAHVKIDAEQPGGFDGWRDLLDAVRTVPGVRAATPIAAGEAMASSSSNTAGVLVRGVDPQSIGQVVDLPVNLEVGKLEWLEDEVGLARLPPETPIGIASDGQLYFKGPDLRGFSLDASSVDAAVRPPDVFPGLIVGRELARTLHVYVGDEITLVTPLGDLGPMGVMPRSRRFRIAGIFYSGMYEYDASHAYMRLDTAQEFLDLGAHVTGVDVKLEDVERVDEATPKLDAAVAAHGLRVRDWKALNKNLFSALQLEKIVVFAILGIAIIVASFCIICTLLLMVTEKSKEIAILKAIGASDGAILRVFMLEGVVIGSIGTVFGVVTGLVMALSLSWFGVRLDPDVYYVDRLPIAVNPADYALVALSALVITTLATLYPARAASQLRPVEGIRWE